MASPGRTPKFCDETVAVILAAVADGVPARHAAAQAGVTERTVLRWKTKGRAEPTGPFRSFLSGLKKAESEAVATRVRRIQAAGKGGALVERKSVTVMGVTTVTEKYAQPQWTADAWHLERTDPAGWGTGRQEIKDLRKLLGDMKARLDDLPPVAPVPVVVVPPIAVAGQADGHRPA